MREFIEIIEIIEIIEYFFAAFFAVLGIVFLVALMILPIALVIMFSHWWFLLLYFVFIPLVASIVEFSD